MKEPLISIIITYYNSSAFLENAIFLAKNQTYKLTEIIVVDDGSSPTESAFAESVALKLNVKYFFTKNKGPAGARNFGVSKAHGEWIAFFDVDDIWHPEKLELQTKQIKQNGDILLIFHDTNTISEDGSIEHIHQWNKFKTTTDLVDSIIRGEIYSFTSSIMIEKNYFLKIKGFNETLRFLEDHLFLLVASQGCRWECLPRVLSSRVKHKFSSSHVSKNLDFDKQISRKILFLDAAEKVLDSPIDRSKIIQSELLTCYKKALVAGKTVDSIKLLINAWKIYPLNAKLYWLTITRLITFVNPGRFDYWYPSLAAVRKLKQ